jgi:hypothetical protein
LPQPFCNPHVVVCTLPHIAWSACDGFGDTPFVVLEFERGGFVGTLFDELEVVHDAFPDIFFFA